MFRRKSNSLAAGTKKASVAAGWQNAYLESHQEVTERSGGLRLAMKSFRALDDDRNGYVSLAQIKESIDESGVVLESDPRLQQFRSTLSVVVMEHIAGLARPVEKHSSSKSQEKRRPGVKKKMSKNKTSRFQHHSSHSSMSDRDAYMNDEYDSEIKLGFEDFQILFGTAPGVLHQIFTKDLVIPNFPAFCSVIEEIYHKVKRNRGGKVATYIPQLASVDPEKFAISVCTKSGQRFSIGSFDDKFSVQSTSKPLSYCIALEEHGENVVHKHVGREPSGREFNEMVLNKEDLPHNPMINAGAIMSCSLIKPGKDASDRFEHVLNVWTNAMGGTRPGFSNSTYLSERQTAFRNFALAYLMKEKGAFPDGASVQDILEFYFQVCSIETTADDMAVIAGTLASSGTCPITDRRVFEPGHVRNCLSLMYSCGMYDFSGEFAFNYGIPCKSGVSGVVMGIIPDALGIVVYSPAIDQHGNSVRGVKVFEELTKRFNFHMYDVLLPGISDKSDPTIKVGKSDRENVFHLISAAAAGELAEVMYLSSVGMDLDSFDYDKRTPLHLAAAEGHLEVVKYLVERNVKVNVKDRFGNTALDDAIRHGHEECCQFLEAVGDSLESQHEFKFNSDVKLIDEKLKSVTELSNNIEPISLPTRIGEQLEDGKLSTVTSSTRTFSGVVGTTLKKLSRVSSTRSHT